VRDFAQEMYKRWWKKSFTEGKLTLRDLKSRFKTHLSKTTKVFPVNSPNVSKSKSTNLAAE